LMGAVVGVSVPCVSSAIGQFFHACFHPTQPVPPGRM
jgi:hypothetical protein